MEIKEKLIELLKEESQRHLEDDEGFHRFLQDAYKLLTINLMTTINCIDELPAELFYYVTSVFDDISKYFKSKELIECMKRNAIRTGVDCSVDIEYAIKEIEN